MVMGATSDRDEMSSSGELPDTPQSAGGAPFRPRCISLDLEVGRKDGRIRALGAIRWDTDERFSHFATPRHLRSAVAS